MQDGCKNAVAMWHRRAGKALWNGVDSHSGTRKIFQAFPEPYVEGKPKDQEMMLKLASGATWQLLGADRYDTLVGSGPKGMVVSEFSLTDPMAMAYFKPMLIESDGWVIYNGTVRGKNHFWQLGEFAKTEPDWFFQNLTVDDTGIFSQKQLDAMLREYKQMHGDEEGEALFRQEFYNDPLAIIPGYTTAHSSPELRQRSLYVM